MFFKFLFDSQDFYQVLISLTIKEIAAQTMGSFLWVQHYIIYGCLYEFSTSIVSFFMDSAHQLWLSVFLTCISPNQSENHIYNEIQDAADSNGGNISYQVLMKLPFMDTVINDYLKSLMSSL